MASFHPNIEQLTEFTAGTLSLAQSTCVSVHLSQCDLCSRLTGQLTDLAASFFEGLEPISVGDEQLDSVLARLDEAPSALAQAKSDSGSSTILQRLINGDFSKLNWKKVGSALKISYLDIGDPNFEVALYHIKAGGKIPRHTHRGDEMTLVLEGGFSDSGGSYHAGDFLYRNANDEHAPTAQQSEDCICLAVLDAPLKFTDWRFRLMNPFLKLHTTG
jgi:putative transcriptional regulator